MHIETPDLINGLFEGVGAVFMALNIRKAYKDKLFKGVHWSATGFFTVWGLWNVYFYPVMGLWASFIAGVGLVSLQMVWLGQMFWYRRYPGGRTPNTIWNQ